MSNHRRYWLLKSEPDCYSIDDLERDERTFWDGIRNYQARNFMRDDMKNGDLAFFYHSGAEPPGIVGIAEIVREAYPDHTQFDPTEDHFDAKSTEENPRWLMVDVGFIRKFRRTVPLAEIKSCPELDAMIVTQRGSRLSVQPVSEEEWNRILEFEGI